MNLKDKTVLITGSSSGIGQSTAIRFAEEGANIVVNYKSNSKGAQDTVEEVKKLGRKSISIQADIADPVEVKKLFAKTIKTFAGVDILINNAGLAKATPFLEITKNELIEEFGRNFFSFVYCSQEAAKIIQKQKRGKIINISSICALTGCTSVLSYTSARSAVTGFTKALAKILAPDITVNAVAPGFTHTRYWKGTSKKVERELLDSTLTKKWVSSEEIARSIVFLAQNDSMTGQILIVDGGYTASI